MIFKRGRYSGFLRPISYGIDLLVIHGLAFLLFEESSAFTNYVFYMSIAWISSSISLRFYEIYRFTKFSNILSLAIKQALVFLLLVFAFFGFYGELQEPTIAILKYVVMVMGVVFLIKISIYYLLKKYRRLLGGNLRRVVILGANDKTKELENFFTQNAEYGYALVKRYDVQHDKEQLLEGIFKEISDSNVDEIYASVNALSDGCMAKVIDFADNNLKVLKFLPDNKEIFGMPKISLLSGRNFKTFKLLSAKSITFAIHPSLRALTDAYISSTLLSDISLKIPSRSCSLSCCTSYLLTRA